MWDNPEALDRLSRWLLLLTAAYAVVAIGRGLGDTAAQFKHVDVLGARHEETRSAARPIVQGLSGGFFSLGLESVRAAFEGLPWVRSATVRKVWPDRLVVELTEHVPAAAWNGTAMLDTYGEVFQVRPYPGLPRIFAPDGMEKVVARRYWEFVQSFRPLGLAVESVQLSPRHAWRLQFADGLVLELGRERLNERMRRFIAAYPHAVAEMGALARVDMRYPNGFAVTPGEHKAQGKAVAKPPNAGLPHGTENKA